MSVIAGSRNYPIRPHVQKYLRKSPWVVAPAGTRCCMGERNDWSYSRPKGCGYSTWNETRCECVARIYLPQYNAAICMNHRSRSQDALDDACRGMPADEWLACWKCNFEHVYNTYTKLVEVHYVPYSAMPK